MPSTDGVSATRDGPGALAPVKARGLFPTPDPGPGLDGELVARLRTGDEAAFVSVFEAWSPGMLRVARGFLSTQASAEEVVQDAWLAVIRGLEGFEGRSALRTWTYRILANLARSRAVRESRTVPWSSWLADDLGPAESPEHFIVGDDEWAGWWTDEAEPQIWLTNPESAIMRSETREILLAALKQLPAQQRVVVILRDAEGFGSDEVCDMLQVTAPNQRVLLHRGRVKLRAALSGYFQGRGLVARES